MTEVMMNGKCPPPVRRSDGVIVPFNKDLIVKSLVRETQLVKELYGERPLTEEEARVIADEVQEEILWIAEAAHVPVIWATQVLESLAKTGRPSRAEITDAAMGERAECVMLNKGPYVVAAVRVLDDILRRMEAHQEKKTAMLRKLRVASAFAPHGLQ